MRTLVETGVLVGERGAYRLAQARASTRSRPPCRRCWRRASTACRPRTSGCSRPPPSSARTCRSRCSRPLPTCPRTMLRRGLAPPPGGGVPVRDQPLSGSRVHVQARAHPRGGVPGVAPRPAARASHSDRGRDRTTLSRSCQRASRAPRPPLIPGRPPREGHALSPAGRRQGGGALCSSGGGDLVRSWPEWCGKAKWRILPVCWDWLTHSRPPGQAATGGMRHGRAYQDGRAAA